MNNNKLDQTALEAHCRGVFSKTGFITIGNKDKPEAYGGSEKKSNRANYSGKQFGTIAPRAGHTNDVYFEKKHNWISEGDKYVDKIAYRELQPVKKKGFLTSDYKKRDEFSNTIRTEQWREQLQQEGKFSKQALEMMGAVAAAMAHNEAHHTTIPDGPTLFDLVFEKHDPHAQGCSRTHRDTKNVTILSQERNFGKLSTTSLITFQPPTDFVKPPYARKPIIRDTFYRRTGHTFQSPA